MIMDIVGIGIPILWGLFCGSAIAFLAYKELKIEGDKPFSMTKFIISVIAFVVVGGLAGTFAYLYLNV